jgi:hypothetical protein
MKDRSSKYEFIYFEKEECSQNTNRELEMLEVPMPMYEQETLEEAAEKSFGEIWASLTTQQSKYLKGYINRQIDIAKKGQQERSYSEDEVLDFLKKEYEYF